MIIDKIINTASKAHQHRGGGWRSVTELINPAWQAKLKREHHEAVKAVQAQSVNVWALFGTATHHLLEMAAQHDHTLTPEVFVSHLFGDRAITGTADLMYRDNDKTVLCDWKTVSVWTIIYGDRIAEWTAQLNIYRYMLAKEHKLDIDRLEVCALIKDWNRTKALHDSSYPQSDRVVIPLEVWSDEQTEEYVYNRIGAHETASEPCSAEERWAKPSTYAVLKKGRKTALRVLHSAEDAEQWMRDNGGDEIEHREGDQYVRCRDYCDCGKAGVCPFFSEAKDEGK